MEGETDLKVLFWGNFIPLQGVPTIIRAAALLVPDGNVHFDIIGDGQTSDEVQVVVESVSIPNVTFYGRKPLREIPEFIERSDICLGIFGSTGKAARVIPNKLYEAIAMAKPVVTADTPAIHELFMDCEDVLLCRIADPADLAAKIRIMRDDEELRRRIAEGGYRNYQKFCTPPKIGMRLLVDLNLDGRYGNCV